MALKDGLGGGTGIADINHEINVDTIITGTTKLYFRDAGIYLQSDEDGKLSISADGSGDVVKFKLGDKVGGNAIIVEDSDTFPVVRLDSAGNAKLKGTVKRVV